MSACTKRNGKHARTKDFWMPPKGGCWWCRNGEASAPVAHVATDDYLDDVDDQLAANRAVADD